MFDISTLQNIIILFGVPIFLVILFRRIYLSSVLAYLVSGAIIGDHGFKFVTHSQTSFIAEIGIVFLLFSIGLELSFERLKAMRKYVFGLGSLQIIICASVFWVVLSTFIDFRVAVIVSGALALSSTAVVLKILHDQKIQSTQLGRVSFAILLQQDFAVVPLLVILPILASPDQVSLVYMMFLAMLKAVGAMLLIFLSAKLFLRPAFKLISSESSHNNNEIFIAATILLVLVAAYTTEYLGLSMALGAFLAGIMVAETEFRVSAEESIFPFKDLLLGLFFMHVGMTIDVMEIYQDLEIVVLGSIGLILTKTFVIAILCKIFGFSNGLSLNTGLLLSQGGEFAFVLFNIAQEYNLLDPKVTKILLIIVTITMAMTPMTMAIGKKLVSILDSSKTNEKEQLLDFGASDLNNHVIVCGFGSVGQLIAASLQIEEIPYIAIDLDRKLVRDNYEKYPVFRGDVTQMEILKGAGIKRCLAVIMTINNLSAQKKAISNITEKYPKLNLIAKIANMEENAEYPENISLKLVPSDFASAKEINEIIFNIYGIKSDRVTQMHFNNSYKLGKKEQSRIKNDIASLE